MSFDKEGTPYGSALRKKHFLLAEAFCNLNHGSFGACPRQILEAQQSFVVEQETRPDRWFRANYFDVISESRRSLANLVNANHEDVVMVENASAAVNGILRSIGLKKGDKVMRLSTAYGMVIHTMNWLSKTLGIEQIIVDVKFPVKDATQIIQSVEAALDDHPDIKIFVFSHISSMPSIVLPAEELVSMSKQRGVLVLIDAAHAPGAIDINIKELQPDFYLGNLHKWLFAPKGTAFLYVAPSQQSAMEPTVISSRGLQTFVEKFEYTGTRDYSAFCTVPACLKFIDDVGGLSQMRSYNNALVVSQAQRLAAAWGTELLVPADMCAFMSCVVLPSCSARKVTRLQKILDTKYDIFIVCSFVRRKEEGDDKDKDNNPSPAYIWQRPEREGDQDDKEQKVGGGAWMNDGPEEDDGSDDSDEGLIFYTRLSAQVYLGPEDFDRLEQLVPALLRDEEDIRPL